MKGKIISYKDFKNKSKDIFDSSDFLVFIMASGIVVRSIANLLESKFTDPAVLVIDELGKNVISLLSGHIGGANEMTNLIAEKISANPVITTATDINNKGAFDMLLKYTDAKIENIRDVCIDINSRLLKNENIYLYIQSEYINILKNYIKGFIIIDEFEAFKRKYKKNKLGYSQERFIIITDRLDYIESMEDVLSEKMQNAAVNDMQDELIFRTQNAIVSDMKALFMQSEVDSVLDKRISDELIILIPRKNVLGVGCRKQTDSKLFESVILSYLEDKNVSIQSIKKLASIDIKKDEKCILDFSKKYCIETEFLSVEDISKFDMEYEKSDFVKNTVGVYSVAEPSCHILCEGNIITKKYKANGITVSLGRSK
nr:cobalamin biosynthesis protein [Peptostreptococcus russellii]